MKFILPLLISSTCLAQSIKTDYGVYPEPPPPTIPAAGNTFVDPTFGTTLLRVTDANDGNDNMQAYSYWPSFNKNSTLLYIFSVGGSPTLYDFDTLGFSISNKRAMFPSNPPGDGAPNAEDAIWSGTSNNKMLCHTSQKLYSYDVVNGTYTLLHNFGNDYSNLYLQQMSRSINDSVFAFTFKENVNYTNVGYITYRVATNAVDTGSLSLDEVQVDKTGNYLVIKTGNSGAGVIEVEIKNLLNGNIEYLTDNGPDYSPGHSDNGMGFVIGADNWNNAYTFRSLANPHVFYDVLNYQNDWSMGDHVSMLANDESWILVSTFIANTLPTAGIFRDELFQVATDGSKAVRRLCHTHSDYLNQSGGNAYWSSPRANISRNGKYAVFTSNWGSTTRRDVFVLQIPLASTTGISGTAKDGFEVYPNPATDKIQVKLPQRLLNTEVNIFDLFGRPVFSKKSVSSLEEITLSDLEHGTYFLRAGELTKKIILTK